MMPTGWDAAAGERLRLAVRKRFTQEAFAEAAGIGRTTLNRIYAGGDPGLEKLGRFAELLETTAAALQGDGDSGAEVVEVPVYDIEVAAGAGRDPLAAAAPLFQWAFPADWAAANLGDLSAAQMFRVSGDSQWPELSDGDLIVVDPRSRRAGDDLHVVRVGNQLKVKRIAREGSQVRLLSRNELYPEEVVDLAGNENGFEIVGRAVCSIKLL